MLSLMMNHKRNNLVWHLLDQHLLSNRRDAIAVRDETGEITYTELAEQVMCFLSKHKQLRTVPTGSRILCLLDDNQAAVITLLALMRLGLVPCIINPNLPNDSYDDYLKIAAPNRIIVPSSHYLKFKSILEQTNVELLIIDKLEQRGTASIDDVEITALAFDSDAFGLFTSGTTGKPNLIIHRHKDPVITIKNYVLNTLSMRTNDVLFSTSKLFFAYGLNSLLYALYHGATAILSPTENSLEKIWGIINALKPTILFSVPTMYSRLLEYSHLPKSLSHVRLCVSAGEHLPSSLFEKWQHQFNVSIIDGIGTTEILSTFISNTPSIFSKNSTGKLVSGFTAEIRDESNRVLPIGEIGLLWIRGGTYPSAYINNSAMSQDRFVNGWFKTYDLFSCCQFGFYYYHGRASDLIKCGGIWIFPHRIEAILNAHPNIKESAVVCHEYDGLQRPVAYIVLRKKRDYFDGLASELKQQCKEKCSKYEYPHMIYVVDDIPKTATGKLQRYKLRENTYDTIV
jgi:acyl-coenzyme A synthetase/AMP-(fatty) acid ligase